jgi:hypothetical protein
MARLLKNKKLAGPLVVPIGTFGFRFTDAQDSNRLTMAIWNPNHDVSIQLTVPEGEYICVNAIGEENEIELTPASSSGLDRVLTLELKKGAPLYLVRK